MGMEVTASLLQEGQCIVIEPAEDRASLIFLLLERNIHSAE